MQRSLISLICNYLRGRPCLNGQSSLSYEAIIGQFPSGLGSPATSLLNVYNAASLLFSDCMFVVYTDDVKFLTLFWTRTTSCYAPKRAISYFSRWCSCNELFTSSSKTIVLTYIRKTVILVSCNINSELLPGVVEVNDLVINFDGKLSFCAHIKVITRRALRSRGVVGRALTKLKEVNFLVRLYTTISHPQLKCASEV